MPFKTFTFVNALRIFPRYFSQNSSLKQGASGASTVSPSAAVNPNVPGLTSSVIHPANEPLGPGVDPNKSGPYKVPEYFCYDKMSYFEAEIEMAKYRLPQPSAVKK